MAKTNFKSVDDYLATQPQQVRDLLEQVRAIIHKALPGVEEVISYQIPAFKLNGTTFLYTAGWKKHYSLYPIGESILANLAETALPYETSKGTIRFPLDEPVPAQLIESIAKARALESAKEKEQSAKKLKKAVKASG